MKELDWEKRVASGRENMDNFIPKNAAVLCARCKNQIPGTFNCKVYPDGIPEKYLGADEPCKDRIPRE